MRKRSKRAYERPGIRSERMTRPSFAQTCDMCPSASNRLSHLQCQTGVKRFNGVYT